MINLQQQGNSSSARNHTALTCIPEAQPIWQSARPKTTWTSAIPKKPGKLGLSKRNWTEPDEAMESRPDGQLSSEASGSVLKQLVGCVPRLRRQQVVHSSLHQSVQQHASCDSSRRLHCTACRRHQHAVPCRADRQCMQQNTFMSNC